MPLPPYHLAPGLAGKVFGSRRFSFTIFVFSQVLMDLEPLIRIYAGSATLHGFTNTMLGATVVGVFSAAVGKPICERILNLWNEALRGRRLQVDSHISWESAIVSAAAGVYVHAILDAIMHVDAQPWLPFSSGNPFIGLLSTSELHLLCIGLGAFGLLCLIGMWFWNLFTCEMQE